MGDVRINSPKKDAGVHLKPGVDSHAQVGGPCEDMNSAAVRFDDKFLSEKKRLEDFEYLFSTVSQYFPFFGVQERLGYSSWRSRKGEWQALIRNADDPDSFYSAVKTIMQGLHNLHSHILPKDQLVSYLNREGKTFDPYREEYCRALPASDYWKEVASHMPKPGNTLASYYIDGHYFIKDHLVLTDDSEIPAGAEIYSIDGIPVQRYISENKDRMTLVRDGESGGVYADNLFANVAENQTLFMELIDPENLVKLSEVYQGQIQKITSDAELCADYFIPAESEINKVSVPTKKVKLSVSDIKKKDVCFTHNIRWNGYFYLDLVPGNVAYVKLQSFGDKDYSARDVEEFATFVEKNKDAKAVIIDIRDNAGGESSRWTDDIVPKLLTHDISAVWYYGMNEGQYLKPFINARMSFGGFEMVGRDKYPPAAPQEIKNGEIEIVYSRKNVVEGSRKEEYKPKIYLLVNRGNYSSAEHFAAWAKQSKWATVVGEQTGGDGVNFDAVPLILPNSKLALRFRWLISMDAEGRPNNEFATMPDIRTEWSSDEWIRYCEAQWDAGWQTKDAQKDRLLHRDPDVAAVLKDIGVQP